MTGNPGDREPVRRSDRVAGRSAAAHSAAVANAVRMASAGGAGPVDVAGITRNAVEASADESARMARR